MLRIAACDGMVFQLAEATRKRHMLGARDLLIAQEHHPMFQQRRSDLGKQAVIVNGIGQIHADQLGPERAG